MILKNLFPANLIEYIPELLNQANLGIVVTDPNQIDNPVIYINDYFFDMLGYSHEEIIGKNCRFLQGDASAQEAVQEIRTAVKEGKAISRVLQNYKKDGTLIYNQLTISPIYDEEKKLKFFLGVQRDVTQLHFSLEQVKATENLVKIAYWELDIASNHLHWSDEVFRLFEIDKKRFGANYEAFLNTIHPQDREIVNNAYIESLHTQKPYSIEHRLLMDDDRIKYVEEKCLSYFNEESKPIKSIGIIQDITYLKKMELELSNTLSFLKSYKLAIDESNIVTKTDKNGIITYANKNFCLLSGYTKSEVIGKSHNIVMHPDNPRELFKDLWKTINAKKSGKK